MKLLKRRFLKVKNLNLTLKACKKVLIFLLELDCMLTSITTPQELMVLLVVVVMAVTEAMGLALGARAEVDTEVIDPKGEDIKATMAEEVTMGAKREQQEMTHLGTILGSSQLLSDNHYHASCVMMPSKGHIPAIYWQTQPRKN